MNSFAKKIALSVLTVFLLSACSMSTEDLSKEVVKSMEKTFKDQGGNVAVKSLVLTKKAGNEYAGVLETQEPNGKFTYSVEVIFDGTNMTWKIVN
jgi:hypothetical protein